MSNQVNETGLDAEAPVAVPGDTDAGAAAVDVARPKVKELLAEYQADPTGEAGVIVGSPGAGPDGRRTGSRGRCAASPPGARPVSNPGERRRAHCHPDRPPESPPEEGASQENRRPNPGAPIPGRGGRGGTRRPGTVHASNHREDLRRDRPQRPTDPAGGEGPGTRPGKNRRLKFETRNSKLVNRKSKLEIRPRGGELEVPIQPWKLAYTR